MPHAKPRRILVAVDFSAPCSAAMETAKQYAVLTGAPLVLVHVLYLTDNLFGAGTFALPEIKAQITQSAKDELQKMVASVLAEGIGCEGVVMFGIPDEEICKYAADPKNEVDLLVVGTHGRTGLARVAFGSVAQRILQRTPCPALVVPMKKEAS
ncbi:MAG: universal stress protein [Myxococcales bacterium]|nr:universal stress protein [Polyangiaceae bacterium]MDW8250820.1 universal stress protein [Myxococcales bacterium]